MDENEKLVRILLGSLFALSNGIDINYSMQDIKDMILLLTDLVAKKIDIELTDSQVSRLMEECGLFVIDCMVKETSDLSSFSSGD